MFSDGQDKRGGIVCSCLICDWKSVFGHHFDKGVDSTAHYLKISKIIDDWMNDFYIGVGAKVFKNDNTKEIFTYEYTWQNFRLQLFRLAGAIL